MKHSFSDPIAAHGWETGEALQFGGPDTSPDPLSSLRHIERMANWLSKAMALAAGSEPVASSAAEWLLDNGYQVQRAMLLVHKDMPEGFYARLRPVTAGPASCEPRVLMLAHDLLVASHFQLSRDNVMAYLQGYQSHSALDIAELWALPAMLRIACLERLVVGFEDIFPDLPPPFVPSKTCNSFLGTLESIDCVARSIANLGVISSIDWKDIFDQCSEVDKALSQDPARTYPNMDFETRDACRRVIEQVARHSGSDEVAIAGAALDLSRQHDELPMSHVGYWLIGEGFPRLEQSLGVTRSLRRRVVRWLRRHPGGAYAAALFLCGIVGMAIPLAYLWMQGATVWQWVLALVVTALPATVLSVTIVNWLVTQAVSPKRLAKLDFSEGIAPDWPTLVIVPVIVAGRADIDAALQRLSAHQLANPEAAAFVLLSDPVDALEQRSADDDLVEARLREGIETLNKQRGPCFCLMHRARMFNPAQGCWMAWERKRGKIEQFNEFLLTGNAEAFPVTAGPTADLTGAKFVVTADADTRLPPGCVARLAGTLAHPLNRPRIDRDGRITAGYSVMQPRIEIAPHGANSLFARLFGGDTAIDIYSRAVSDVYQDLTGTGNFIGKGIYDVAAFHRSLAGRVPENQLLSHDLWEGLHGRAALVSDVVFYESFPESYGEYARRWHRWVRGDWQLLPWLLPRVPGPDGKRLHNRLSLFDRLRIWDTMRRSLVPASVMMLLIAGWFLLPGSALFWTVMALLVPGAWLFTDLVTGLARGRRRGVLTSTLRETGAHLQRWALQVVFLPSNAITALHAIGLTLIRLKRGEMLLEWTTAAQVSQMFARGSGRSGQWGSTWTSPVSALLVAALLGIDARALPWATPLLVLWLIAPEIAWQTSRPRSDAVVPATKPQQLYLRRVARRSWLYFERYAGPEDNWLPPDNHQEGPRPATAHRTSPTNIGMLALSTLSAWRLGFIGSADLARRMHAVLDTVDQFELWHGHIFNWHDTRTLAPLEPRYVSTVDSGNLAVSLVVLASGCRQVAIDPAMQFSRWEGLRDCIALLRDAFERCGVDVWMAQHLEALQRCLPTEDIPREEWPHLLDQARRELGSIRVELVELVTASQPGEPASLHAAREWLERCEHHIATCSRDLATTSDQATQDLIADLTRLADRAEAMAEAMDFSPLYDRRRKLFHIGFDVTAQRIDPHYYDLLASEARLASYYAIAKRDIPFEHWFHLGRPTVKHEGKLSLVSWNGSMFEYLMPSLFLRSDPATLLGETETAAVAIQQRYALDRRVPWGISESGFASCGSDGAWRYRAFGVPALGLRRGLEEDLVIAPYASALALAAAPSEAVANLQRLSSMGALGQCGFYEALDYTPERVEGPSDPVMVRSYMAHHHGMSIAAITNALTQDVLVDWFHADERIESADLLLNERVPWELPTELQWLAKIPARPSLAPEQLRAEPWEWSPSPRPLVKLLGNGRLKLDMGADGCGDLTWRGHVVTAPAGPDRNRGQFMYLRNAATGHVWSPSPAPVNGARDRRTIIHPHKLEMRCHAEGVAASLDILVSPSQDVEIRRLRLVNETPVEIVLDFASHADVALADADEWARHPAFARLFVEAEPHPEIDALLFTRRQRSPETPGLAMVQRLVFTPQLVEPIGCEVSRHHSRPRHATAATMPRFERAPDALDRYPLDAASAFSARVTLPPDGEAEIALVTTLAPFAHEALELAGRHGVLAALDWAEQDAIDGARHQLRRSALAASHLRGAEEAYSALRTVPSPRFPPAVTCSREDLWAVGLSGELPLLLVELDEEFDAARLQFALRAHRLWRWQGASIDLVLLHHGAAGYAEPLRERILDYMRECECDAYLGERGGIAIVASGQLEERRVRALRSAAGARLDATAAGIPGPSDPDEPGPEPVPPLVATRPPRAMVGEIAADSGEAGLAFANGIGGFTPSGDYRIDLPSGANTPGPWANVLANPVFGCIVTEAGLGFTWHGNSGENRLTPWHNDPIADTPGEALYVRDEETGQVWSVSPLPAGPDSACRVEHAPGETRWSRECAGLRQEMTVFVMADEPVKIVTLRITETAGDPRRLTATYFADWLLGANAGEPGPFRASRYSRELGVVLARNDWQAEFSGYTAFLAATDYPHSFTTSRSDFLGLPSDWRRPAGLHAWSLGERAGNEGDDAAAALQLQLEIPAHGAVEATFLLGGVEREDELATLLGRLRTSGRTDAARNAVKQAWETRLRAVQVETPDPAFDVMVNRWLPCQAISSRLFARAGFYQASGAYGFRDQLQDVLAMLLSAPELAREHILRAAHYQFEEGDVLHWWHPPTGKGVRTRCSDDLLWLPFVVARYVSATGDVQILEERIHFLRAPELASDEADRFNAFPGGTEASLYEHCLRAFERSYRLGGHGLPLMGDGDWNDGMNRVGHDGSGESVWLGWFLAATIREFATLCGSLGRPDFALHWLPRRDALIASVEQHGWDGRWYRRAFDGQGRPWGSQENSECRIDALVQAWAVLAGGDRDRSKQAVASAFAELVRPDDPLVRLLDPPFDKTARDPGYIKGYPPGIRENGGQYSHAAAWLGIACAGLGDGAGAKAVFDRINPVLHARKMQDACRYAIEPYAVAGDISGGEEHKGRGGWSWYTGAAGWAWQLATCHILGIALEQGQITLEPCMPPDWPGFSATVKGDGIIDIVVCRGQGRRWRIDGQRASQGPVPFPGAGRRTVVELTLPKGR